MSYIILFIFRFNVILPGNINCTKLIHNKYCLLQTHQDVHIGRENKKNIEDVT